MAERKRITIAALALGGQGGGVLADWILAVGEANGFRAQGTSIAGVAQRTGSTVYYIELFPDDGGPEPILSLNPVPGDIDIVIASELMEAGRAILRGFVSKDRTTIVSSTHRSSTSAATRPRSPRRSPSGPGRFAHQVPIAPTSSNGTAATTHRGVLGERIPLHRYTDRAG